MKSKKNNLLKWILIIIGIIIILIVGVVAYDYFTPHHDPYNPFEPPLVKKPAIYLYPTIDSLIYFKLNINGKIIKDIPEYKNGWNVFATKEGLIDGKYDYLFYEASLNKLELPNEGWIVPYDELDNWFDINLNKFGLNEKEKKQFKEYWTTELPKSNYYEIKILDNKFLNDNMGLDINPKPDSVIRVELYFKPLDNKVSLKEPVVITPQRTGFSVVEWGGILDN
jgi:hypothetical protein